MWGCPECGHQFAVASASSTPEPNSEPGVECPECGAFVSDEDVVEEGWGCLVCGLPSSGALAVLCDACMEAHAEIVDVCHGYAATGQRSARAACTEPFVHDDTKHQEDL